MPAQAFLGLLIGFAALLVTTAIVVRDVRAPYRGVLFLLAIVAVVLTSAVGLVLAVVGLQPGGLDRAPYAAQPVFGAACLVECIAAGLDLVAVLTLLVLGVTSQNRADGLRATAPIAEAWDRAAQRTSL